MNILIVEDEPPILRDIEYTIEALQGDYTIYATALDGQNAIALLEQHRDSIDVLITDIHIPIINGLELISYVHKNMPGIYCIIISGYSEFEYAKKAVQLGVIDYLLKPVNESELRSLLNKIYTKWCLDYLEGHKPLLQQGMAPNTKGFFHHSLAVIRLHSQSQPSASQMQLQADPWHMLDLDAFLTGHSDHFQSYCLTEGSSPLEKYLLLTHSSCCTSTEALPDILFQEILQSDRNVTIVLYTDFDKSCPAKEHFDSLHAYLWENTLPGQSQLLQYKREEKRILSSSELTMLSNHISVLHKLFIELNLAMFYTELEQLLQKMKGLHMNQKDVASYLHMLSDLCASAIPSGKAAFDITSGELLLQLVNQSDSFAGLALDLKTFFHSLFDLLLEEIPASAASSKETLLPRIDNYIMKNCFEAINTKSIADKFGFTPAYLSKLFYEYKNVSPMDYIIQLRMEKAKGLFQEDSELRIKDIAAHVGYVDSLYFSKVFRKYTGKSPKQYRKQNKNKTLPPSEF